MRHGQLYPVAIFFAMAHAILQEDGAIKQIFNPPESEKHPLVGFGFEIDYWKALALVII